MELPPTAASLPGPSHQGAATRPVIITVESSTTSISFIVTANSLTTAGEWSPVLPNLSRGLALPNHISLPTTITIATSVFIINVHATTAGNTFYDVIPATTPIPIINNNNNNVLPITSFPINLTLCLVNTNTNTGLAFGIAITNTFNIAISTQSVQSQFGYAAFVRMD